MSPHLRRPGVATGVVLSALLAVVDILAPWIFPAPPDATAFANALSVVLGVLALAALGLWATTSMRAGMWVSVVLRVIGGVFTLFVFSDDTATTGFLVANVVYLVATIAAVVLVVPTLRARRTASPPVVA